MTAVTVEHGERTLTSVWSPDTMSADLAVVLSRAANCVGIDERT